MLTCLLLLLPENSMQTMLTTLREFNRSNISSIQSYIYASWRARTFVQIYYLHDKKNKQVTSCCDRQTFYNNLWHFTYLDQFYNISKFYDILWFYDSVWAFHLQKKNILGEHTSNFLFPGVFQEFFQESNCIPGVSRRFQEFLGVVFVSSKQIQQ